MSQDKRQRARPAPGPERQQKREKDREMLKNIMLLVMRSEIWPELDHEQKRFVRYGAGQIPEHKPRKRGQEAPTAPAGRSGQSKQKAPGNGKKQRAEGNRAPAPVPDLTAENRLFAAMGLKNYD